MDMTRKAPEFKEGKTYTLGGFYVMSALDLALECVFAVGGR